MKPIPLRVLVVDQANGLWGAQRYVLRLAPLLRQQGVELVLAAPPELALMEAWCAAGLEAVELRVPVERSVRDLNRPTLRKFAQEGRKSVASVRLISHIMRTGNYDALWSNAHWMHVDAGIAGRIVHKPVVLHLHEEALPGLGSSLRGVAVRVATKAVAVSQTVADGLPRFAQRRVCVIPNGVDTAAMSPPSPAFQHELQCTRARLGVNDHHVLVLAVTRLDPPKRIEDLIGAVTALADETVHLVVAGSTSNYPDYERRVRAEAQRLEAGRIIFCGNHDDVAALFRASDVVLHAGTVEGMPLGLLEAQSCGKPVVAYDVAGVSEAVVDGTTGLLADVGDVAGLTAALRRLCADPVLRAKMGSAGRTHVLGHHRIETQAQRNAALLTKLCARRWS